ncbi:MAG TPA: DUF599 domain-containing protein [Burkholderiaceae bacterium]|nr:DUF599 domain-containing protein [Burkholderiaceae bacterium]
MQTYVPWLALAASLLLIAAYEILLLTKARRDPHATARSAHVLLRAAWVSALSRERGTEVLAVQLLRNSLMSATISASTAALALMGCISILASLGGRSTRSLEAFHVGNVLELLLMATLFASYVCSAMSMRYYNHAGFVMSMPVGSPEREQRLPMAVDYLKRAGVLYSWGLRFFLLVAPIVVGLINSLLMPAAAIALVVVLQHFDRGPGALDD